MLGSGFETKDHMRVPHQKRSGVAQSEQTCWGQRAKLAISKLVGPPKVRKIATGIYGSFPKLGYPNIDPNIL